MCEPASPFFIRLLFRRLAYGIHIPNCFSVSGILATMALTPGQLLCTSTPASPTKYTCSVSTSRLKTGCEPGWRAREATVAAAPDCVRSASPGRSSRAGTQACRVSDQNGCAPVVWMSAGTAEGWTSATAWAVNGAARANKPKAAARRALVFLCPFFKPEAWELFAGRWSKPQRAQPPVASATNRREPSRRQNP